MPRRPAEVPEATLRLLLARGLGPRTLRRLRESLGGDDVIAAAPVECLKKVPGLGRESAEAVRRAIDAVDPEGERRAMSARQAEIILAGDEDYPPLLAAIPDPPAALWIRGRLERADRLALAMIGSRRCTTYGREQAARFAMLLAECGLTIVSGGALGIDGEAHRGALRAKGRTVAVLGCGLAHAYPARHDRLFEEIVDAGSAVVSEYAMTMPPRAKHFPRRNRIISGLSLGVLVIEAARRSGALITARLAAEDHGREVMVVPGRIDSASSAGAMEALRDGWAALVLSPTDVLRQLEAGSHLVRGALEASGHPDASGGEPFEVRLTDPQRAILAALRQAQEVLAVERISAETKLPVGRLLADLTMLEVRGCVRRAEGGFALGRFRAGGISTGGERR